VVSSRVVRIAGLAVGAAALVFALLPFSTSFRPDPKTRHEVLYPSFVVSCRAPVVEATRPSSQDGGWFGYAPLTSTPETQGFIGRAACYEPARNRLIVSAAGLFGAALLGWVSASLGGDPGPLRRRRWRPKPA
jgi:hypothetical protein